MTDINIDADGLAELEAKLTDLEEDWGDEPEWIVGSRVHYGVYVEYGTSKQQAQPYLRPAVRAVVNGRGQEFAEEADNVREFLKKFALQVERRAKENAPVDTGTLRVSIGAVPMEEVGQLMSEAEARRIADEEEIEVGGDSE